ncbi:MAG: hypothetical protein ABF649_14580 [Bacillus sp. (in: firmicutes)]
MLILCGSLLGLSGLSTGITAKAAVTSATSSFTNAWTATKKTGDGAGKLTYGFNTAWINEDFAYAIHDYKYHFANVSNGIGSHVSKSVGAGVSTGIEVRHYGSSVNYAINY